MYSKGTGLLDSGSEENNMGVLSPGQIICTFIELSLDNVVFIGRYP